MEQRMHTAERKGFTLIELLVVIAIIAILAAILFPVFAKVREKARQTACLSNTKQLGLGFAQYEQDYDEQIPNGTSGGGLGPQGWANQIYPYVKSDGVFECPDDPATRPCISYAMNDNLEIDHYIPPTYYVVKGTVSISTLQAPASTVLLFEVSGDGVDDASKYGDGPGGVGGNGSAEYFGHASLDYTGALYETGLMGNVSTQPTYNNSSFGVCSGNPSPACGKYAASTGYHTEGSNFLFTDDHAKWLRGTSVAGGSDNTTVNHPGSASAVSPVASNTGYSGFGATFSYD